MNRKAKLNNTIKVGDMIIAKRSHTGLTYKVLSIDGDDITVESQRTGMIYCNKLCRYVKVTK